MLFFHAPSAIINTSILATQKQHNTVASFPGTRYSRLAMGTRLHNAGPSPVYLRVLQLAHRSVHMVPLQQSTQPQCIPLLDQTMHREGIDSWLVHGELQIINKCTFLPIVHLQIKEPSKICSNSVCCTECHEWGQNCKDKWKQPTLLYRLR